jgi:hypothetical protein
MTIAILIHNTVNCKCGSMKMMNRDDEGRGNIFEETDGIFHPHLNPPPSRGRRFFSFPLRGGKVRMGVI